MNNVIDASTIGLSRALAKRLLSLVKQRWEMGSLFKNCRIFRLDHINIDHVRKQLWIENKDV